MDVKIDIISACMKMATSPENRFRCINFYPSSLETGKAFILNIKI